MLRADMYIVSFVGKENIPYGMSTGMKTTDMKIKGDVFSKLEKKGLAFSMEDITRPSNCIKYHY